MQIKNILIDIVIGIIMIIGFTLGTYAIYEGIIL
jgi:hypothetical protein